MHCFFLFVLTLPTKTRLLILFWEGSPSRSASQACLRAMLPHFCPKCCSGAMFSLLFTAIQIHPTVQLPYYSAEFRPAVQKVVAGRPKQSSFRYNQIFSYCRIHNPYNMDVTGQPKVLMKHMRRESRPFKSHVKPQSSVSRGVAGLRDIFLELRDQRKMSVGGQSSLAPIAEVVQASCHSR